MRKKYLKIHIFAGNILMPRFYVGFEIELTLVPLVILPWPWPIFAYIERNSRIRSKGIEGAGRQARPFSRSKVNKILYCSNMYL